MISNNNLTTRYINFKAETNPIGGAAFQPKREIKSMEEHHEPTDKVMKLGTFGKIKMGLKEAFIDIPSSIGRGLQGDPTVSFHEFLRMAKLPYYLGGPMLVACFRAGGDTLLSKKQGVGVALYYSGMALGNNFVNSFVKHKYGIDLDLAYKNDKGETHKVFESLDFTRWDLLTEKDWNQIGDKLGIPQDIVDRDTAVKTEVQKILVRARAWKLVLGALFAATGAGFIARNDAWKKLFGNFQNGSIQTAFKNIFASNSTHKLGSRIGNFGSTVWGALKEEVGKPFVTALKELPGKKLGNFPIGKVTVAALVALPILALINLARTPNKKKVYLTKSEAMPFAAKIEQNPQLRQQVASSIPTNNNVNYENLYSQVAKNTINAGRIQQPAQQIAANSPFAVFEAFMRRGA
jgi:hypothetical protein